jgi:hypothetical protein
LLLILGAGGCSKHAQPPAPATQSVRLTQAKVAPSERARVLDGDFAIIKTTAFLPWKCKSAFAALAHQKQFDMAEPSQKFQETDVGMEPGLPLYRLVFVGITTNKCLIYYEHGGFSHSFYVLVLDTSNQTEVKFLLGWAGTAAVSGLNELRAHIEKGEVKGGYHYLTNWELKQID